MSDSIRIGIAGYGNLGRGVEASLALNPDMTLVGIFTRRAPAQLTPLHAGTPVFAMDALADYTEKIDVLILCGGSKEDLPKQGPELAALFNTVDSFDTHARIPEHFAAVDAPALANQKTALISAGWDPGMFSINRVMGEALLPEARALLDRAAHLKDALHGDGASGTLALGYVPSASSTVLPTAMMTEASTPTDSDSQWRRMSARCS